MPTSKEDYGELTVVRVSGHLTYVDGVEDLHLAVNEMDNNRRFKVILDLSDVTELDRTGVGELIRSYVIFRQKGQVVALAGLSQGVRGMLECEGVLGIFQIFQTRNEALQCFHSNPSAPNPPSH